MLAHRIPVYHLRLSWMMAIYFQFLICWCSKRHTIYIQKSISFFFLFANDFFVSRTSSKIQSVPTLTIHYSRVFIIYLINKYQHFNFRIDKAIFSSRLVSSSNWYSKIHSHTLTSSWPASDYVRKKENKLVKLTTKIWIWCVIIKCILTHFRLKFRIERIEQNKKLNHDQCAPIY